jgi:ABC-type Zn uptake system ZnuABC Zn-binding protein ZnuA
MRLLIPAVALLAAVAGCSLEVPRAIGDSEPEDRGPSVVVSLPLLADVADQVVNGFGVVSVLAPEGLPSTIAPDQEQLIANSNLVLVHGLASEDVIVEAASEVAADRGLRIEAVNEWLDPAPVNAATWFDPIAMARIALELGDVLAEADDDNVRTREDWRAAAAEVATEIAATFDVAGPSIGAIPKRCRRAVGDQAMLEQLGERFDVRPADADDDGAADLRTVDLELAEGQRWQEWFLALIERAAEADPNCAAPSPAPSPSPTA